MSSKKYKVELSKSASRYLSILPKRYYQNVREHIDSLATNPRPRGCEKLKGEDKAYRIRVGVYRILYEVYDDKLVVLVFDIDHRKQVYR